MNNVSSPPAKAPRDVCNTCRISAASPIVVNGKCTNKAACAKRLRRQTSAPKVDKPMGTK